MPAPKLQIVEPLCAVFRRRLKAEGLKYTPERARVLDGIMQIQGPFTADGLLEALSGADSKASKATVYRTIKLLVDSGIIQRLPIGEDHAHYQLAYGGTGADLLVRLDTNEAIPISVPELDAIRDRVCAKFGLKAQGHRLTIFAQGG